MKRRKFIRYVGAGFLATAGTNLVANVQASQAQNSSLSIKWLGHTSFLFTGGGRRILVNPFRPIGCTAGYRTPKVPSDIVMISSQLLDEGVVEGLPGSPKLLYQAGVYKFDGFEAQGVAMPHDRQGGRRFGINVAWLWEQAGLKILHLGGAAGEITFEQKILLGSPDILLLPVGGGPKAYGPQEAVQAMRTINPKLVIPTHYRTEAADAAACDIVAVDQFLSLVGEGSVQLVGRDGISLRKSDLPAQGPLIRVLSYNF